MKLWGSMVALLVCLAVTAAETALDPIPVCEATVPEYKGKVVTLVGRYSFRKTGRWLDQEGCGDTDRRAVVWLTADAKSAPMPPEPMAINENSLERKLAAIKRRTSLGKFRFGSPDYDRWAVVFGRLETGTDQKLQLVYRGDGAIFFFVDK